MFAERRKRLLSAMGPDAVAIIPGAGLVGRSNDTHYRFRQDSDFWYLTGFDYPDATAIFSTKPGASPFTLFVQARDPTAEVWTGYRPGVEGAVADYAADKAEESASLMGELAGLVEGAQRLFHALGRRPEIDQKLIEIQDALRMQSRRGASPPNEWVDPRTILHEMRLFKSEDELELMRTAAEITREGHAEAARTISPGLYEYEIEATLDCVFRKRGGWGPAYESIVAGGANAAILHYVTNNRRLHKGELLLIDAGSEYRGYASDVTRTYPVGGRFEGAGADIYAVVLAAQEAAMEAALPGTTLPALHDLTSRKLVEGMLAIGLLEGDADELIQSEAHRRYYMHGTSHWLGLDVHDSGRYAQGTEPRALEAGMVFTVEPGLYIGENDEAAPEAFRGIGVRIEDDVAIHGKGSENLTSAIPKKMVEVEAWMRAAP
ncbi:MAG: aminopeptidase P N-terminal domain-containing protein [Myxococcota bacterium]|nr:aminopeptidase P N-terminal domain-containing protein [Myxococcota bacterium]